MARVLLTDLTHRLTDLLEIAACVYAADGTVPRGHWEQDASTEKWARLLRLEIEVRDIDFWQRADMTA